MLSLMVLSLSVCALVSFVRAAWKAAKRPIDDICLCGAPMRNGVCSVEDCVCNPKAGE